MTSVGNHQGTRSSTPIFESFAPPKAPDSREGVDGALPTYTTWRDAGSERPRTRRGLGSEFGREMWPRSSGSLLWVGQRADRDPDLDPDPD